MKKLFKILIPMLVLATLLISACAGAAAPVDTSTGGGKAVASPVEFTGVIEAIDGNQWTVGGQVITVDPSVLSGGPFIVGDTIKVEAEVQADGSIVVTRVEASVVEDNSNDGNVNDSDDGNVNDSDDGNVNDSDDGNVNNTDDGDVNNTDDGDVNNTDDGDVNNTDDANVNDANDANVNDANDANVNDDNSNGG